MVLRAYNRRRLAEARLEIACIVTEMDQFMLNGKLKLGELCHDRLYHGMLSSQYSDTYKVKWKFWHRPEKFLEHRAKLQSELENNSELSRLLQNFMGAHFKAFRNRHPFAGFYFSVWVALYAGGMSCLFFALCGIVQLLIYQKEIKAWTKFKQLNFQSFFVVSCEDVGTSVYRHQKA